MDESPMSIQHSLYKRHSRTYTSVHFKIFDLFLVELFFFGFFGFPFNFQARSAARLRHLCAVGILRDRNDVLNQLTFTASGRQQTLRNTYTHARAHTHLYIHTFPFPNMNVAVCKREGPLPFHFAFCKLSNVVRAIRFGQLASSMWVPPHPHASIRIAGCSKDLGAFPPTRLAVGELALVDRTLEISMRHRNRGHWPLANC